MPPRLAFAEGALEVRLRGSVAHGVSDHIQVAADAHWHPPFTMTERTQVLWAEGYPSDSLQTGMDSQRPTGMIFTSSRDGCRIGRPR